MKKLNSRISVMIVCVILGFILTSQFRNILNKSKYYSNLGDADITVEIESLKSQKTALEKSVNDLQAKISEYEKASSDKNGQTTQILEELNNTRLLTGQTDVKGQGVIVTLVPKTGLLGTATDEGRVNDRDIVVILNELRFAGAEALAVNDIRITAYSGIRNSGNYIMINNDERILPVKKVEIKAIGKKEDLQASLDLFQQATDFSGIFEMKVEPSDSISIKRYLKTYSFQYAKTVPASEVK
jgi:uncharacterized protein YlxW (UPF0749 family)